MSPGQEERDGSEEDCLHKIYRIAKYLDHLLGVCLGIIMFLLCVVCMP